MHSAMPYHGVPAPVVAAICRRRFYKLEFPSAQSWRRTVLFLWRNARFREERYCAISLCRDRTAARFQTPVALLLCRELVVSGAWWDYVDEIATHCIGDLLRNYPLPIGRMMRSWSGSDDMWLRRSAIICQVGSGEATDAALLYACIEPSLGRKEFFLRKAIGWSLRQYARVKPALVVRYVRRNEERLSPLSRREALRNVGAIDRSPRTNAAGR